MKMSANHILNKRALVLAGMLLVASLARADVNQEANLDSGLQFPVITQAAASFKNSNPHVEAIFRNGLLDASKQAFLAADGTDYVKTGDIPAEWLRDSSAQVRPYIYFARGDAALTQFMRGMIARQFKYIQIDPYANAFNPNYTVWEEKFELDSLCYPIISAWTYWKHTGDSAIFTDDFKRGLDKAIHTMEAEQDHAGNPRHYTHPELGKRPVGHTGMIWSGFRPSDDACTYNFLIPSEMMAVVALSEAQEIAANYFEMSDLAFRAHRLAEAVNAGIQKYGIVNHPKHGKIYAYEVDGLGQSNLMDDGNLPSLLSVPYFGYVNASDPIYRATRQFILSSDNPFFYSGTLAHGVGSPHTNPGYVWPLALLSQGFTAQSNDESDLVLKELLASDPGDNHLHESFDPNNAKNFSRKDFGWPNSLFAEYMLTLHGLHLPVGNPHQL